MILTWLEFCHIWSDTFNNSSSLMTQNTRKFSFRIMITQSVRIRMAYSSGKNFHSNLIFFGWRYFDIFNSQRLVCFPSNGCLAFNYLNRYNDYSLKFNKCLYFSLPVLQYLPWCFFTNSTQKPTRYNFKK